jgi:hypothetical protein
MCVFNILFCMCVCVPRCCMGTLVAQWGPAVFELGLRRADGHVCVLRLCHRSVARIALGVTWTSRTRSAPWATQPSSGRAYHTTVIDAAGAIYVIGGYRAVGLGNYSANYCNDVWVSTDGGADRIRGCFGGYARGTHRTARGTHEAQGAVKWHSERAGTPHRGYSRGARRGYLLGTGELLRHFSGS